MPPTLRVAAFQGDIDLLGSITLAPSRVGTLDFLAQGSINAFQLDSTSGVTGWGSGLINVSDANPDVLPSVSSPLSNPSNLTSLAAYFTETGATEGLTIQTKEDLHGSINDATLHASDSSPIYIYANSGDISGLTLFSPKETEVVAAQDITDIGLYLQNNNASDISLVQAGRDILAYDSSSPLREEAGSDLLGYNSQINPFGAGAGAPNTGDIQVSGPGTLEVLAGRNFTLGNDAGSEPNNIVGGNIGFGDGIYTGLTSVGGQRNPFLPFSGADIVAAAGLGDSLGAHGLGSTATMDFSAFIPLFLNPNTAGNSYAATYLADLAPLLGLPSSSSTADLWQAFENLSPERQDTLALDAFYLILRDSGRDHNLPSSPGFGNYNSGYLAISTLFPTSNSYSGSMNLTSREIATTNGGDVNLLAPGGGVTVGLNLPGGQAATEGILTVDGGDISIFTDGDVTVGTSRIFTLHGGNEIIWSTHGNIAAGASSKTVVSAPPTRVVVDPTSGAVLLDLAGLATGGGIGVLETVIGAPPGDVDLIAPTGIVDAGDAGIRASGNLNIAALKVLNASNISVGGKSSGVPSGPSVNVGALAAASSAAGSSEAAAQSGGPNQQSVADAGTQNMPSIITVDVLGYGGDDTE
jgi:hypothetical protein